MAIELNRRQRTCFEANVADSRQLWHLAANDCEPGLISNRSWLVSEFRLLGERNVGDNDKG